MSTLLLLPRSQDSSLTTYELYRLLLGKKESNCEFKSYTQEGGFRLEKLDSRILPAVAATTASRAAEISPYMTYSTCLILRCNRNKIILLLTIQAYRRNRVTYHKSVRSLAVSDEVTADAFLIARVRQFPSS